MTTKTISEAVTNISAEYIERAADYSAKKQSNKPIWFKWAATAACFAIAVVIGIGFLTNKPTDFNSLMANYAKDTTVHYTNIDIADRIACYHEVSVDSNKLEKYIGEQYKIADSVIWYLPAEVTNLKYLIRQENSGGYSLWVFSNFVINEGDSYTYGDVLKTIYGVNGADDFISITTTPSNANNTDLGKAIQEEIGTSEYTERESIETFYKVVREVICYGEDGGFRGDDTRFTYSFSTDEKDKLTSGESTYGTRFIKVTLKSGTTIDSWKYDALSGCFFEYGGIFTEPLTDEAVNKLNNIFGIK